MSAQGWSADGYLERKEDASRAASLLRIGLPLGILFTLLGSIPQWRWPLEFKWLGVAFVTSLCLLELAIRLWSSRRVAVDRIDALLLALVGWIALSLIWSPDRLGGLDTVIKVSCFALIFFVLRHTDDDVVVRRSAAAFVAACFISVGLDIFKILPWGGFYNQNYITEPVLMAIPAALFLGQLFQKPLAKWLGFAAAAVFLSYLLFKNPSKIEFAVLPAMTLVFLLGRLRLMWQKVSVALGVIVVIATLIVLGWSSGVGSVISGFRGSVMSRLELTSTAAAMWAESPILGRGAGAFSALYPEYQKLRHPWLPFDSETLLIVTGSFAEAAHNELMQFLLSFGLVGVMLLGLSMLVSWRYFQLRERSTADSIGVIACGGLMANALIDYPFQIASSALVATIMFAWWLRGRSKPLLQVQESEYACLVGSSRPKIPTIGAVLLAALAATPLWWASQIYSAMVAYTNSVAIRGGNPQASFDWAMRAASAYPFSGLVRAELAASLGLWNARGGIGKISPEDQDRIFSASMSAGLYPAALLTRLEYLVNTDRDQFYQPETAKWRDFLKRNSAHIPEVWMLDAFYATKYHDRATAKASLERYLSMKEPGNEAKDVVDIIRNELAVQEAAEKSRVGSQTASGSFK